MKACYERLSFKKTLLFKEVNLLRETTLYRLLWSPTARRSHIRDGSSSSSIVYFTDMCIIHLYSNFIIKFFEHPAHLGLIYQFKYMSSH